jgi:23S rRNA (guanosine2251-2'-O)-methyltransferase
MENKNPAQDKIFGRNPVLEALRSDDVTVNKIIVSKTAQGSAIKEILTLAKLKKIPVHHVPPEKFDAFQNDNNQGVAAETSPLEYLDLYGLIEKTKDERKRVFVVLDSIEDPHNLGAIARNAVAFGASGIVIGKWRSSNITQTVIKTSAGAIEHIPVARVSNIAETVSRLKEEGFMIVGAETGGTPLSEIQFSFPLAIVIGSEGEGLQRLIKERCDNIVSIPQTGRISSLNASCASAIVLYEVFKTKSAV